MRPDISVVIQTYQHAAFIRQCVESVLGQETTFSVEIVIGEDGSTDGTADIVADLAHANPERIRAFHRSRSDVIHLRGKPTGRSNLFKSIAAARGRFIAILDGDDYYVDMKKLDLQARLLNDDPAVTACCHDHVDVDAAGEWLATRSLPKKAQVTLLAIAEGRHAHGASFLSQNAITSLPAWCWRLPYSDWPLMLLRAGRGRIVHLDRVMLAYRQHGGGIYSAASPIDRLRGDQRTARIVRLNWPDRDVARAAGNREFRALLALARRYNAAGERRAARVAIAEARRLLADGQCDPTMRRRWKYLRRHALVALSGAFYGGARCRTGRAAT